MTQVTVAPSPVWRRRRRGGDELFNQPALLASDVLLSYGEVRRAGDNKQHLLTRRLSHDSPRIEHPRNLDFPEDRASFQRAAVE